MFFGAVALGFRGYIIGCNLLVLQVEMETRSGCSFELVPYQPPHPNRGVVQVRYDDDDRVF